MEPPHSVVDPHRYTFTPFDIYGTGAVYSPQGHQVTFTTYSKEARLYDVDTGDCCMILSGHTSRVTGAMYSPKGNLLGTGSMDKTVRIWDVASGQCQVVISGFNNYVRKVIWSSSTELDYFVTTCDTGSLRMWWVAEDGGSYRVRLCWSSGGHRLTTTNASIHDVRGLSLINEQLLKQRGAVGEPSFVWPR